MEDFASCIFSKFAFLVARFAMLRDGLGNDLVKIRNGCLRQSECFWLNAR